VLEHDQSLLRRIDAQGNRLVGQGVRDGIEMRIDTDQHPCANGMHHAPTITGLQPAIGVDLRIRRRQGWQARERAPRVAVTTKEGLIGPLLLLLDPADRHAAGVDRLGLLQVGVQSQQALQVASCGIVYCFHDSHSLLKDAIVSAAVYPLFFALPIRL
jgi:hypothetical protein